MMRRTALALLALLAFLVVAAACGSSADPQAESEAVTTMPPSTTVPDESSELELIVLPGLAGQLPPDVTVGCRAGPTLPAAALASVVPIEAPGYESSVKPSNKARSRLLSTQYVILSITSRLRR